MAGWRGRGLRATLLAVLALLSGEQFPHTSFLSSSKLILYSSYSAPMPHSHPLGAHHQPAGATHLHAVRDHEPDPLVLDCEVEIGPREQGFVLKWLFNNHSIYQWIPSVKGFAMVSHSGSLVAPN